jgi:hypothetical protein
MVLKSIGVFSMAKMMGTLYAVVGFILGSIFALLSIVGAGFASQEAGGAFWGLIFGVGGVIILPIFYGVFGFIGGALMSALYNFIAAMAGGVELDLE